MVKSKIIQLFQSFSATELRAFGEFVASPFFNKKEELVTLFTIITEDEGIRGGEMSKEFVFNRLYPDKPFDSKRVHYLVSDLSKLAERFLAINHYENEPIRQSLDLLSCFIDRDLEKPYRQVRQRLTELLKTRPQKEDAFYLHQLQLADLEEKRFGKLMTRRFDPNLQYASDHLDRYYFLKKLEYACGMLDRQAVLKGEYHLNLSEHLITHLTETSFLGHELIALHYTALMALKEEDEEEHFTEFRKRLHQQSEAIPRDNLRHFYYVGINYCARKIRKGHEKYVAEALELYLEGINRSLFFEGDHLSPWTFTNIIKLALRLKRYKWIEHFINQYSKSLPENFRHDALHYNLAELYYYTRDFDQALEHLNQVKLSDLNFHLGSRVILAKIYFETDEEEALLSLIAAFTIFLKRNKQISNQLKKTYLNFCDILFQIMKNKPRKMAALGEKIKSITLLTDRGWLLQIYQERMAASGD